MRQAARKDSNQDEIAMAAMDAGASFLSLAALGRGAPDAVVGYRYEHRARCPACLHTFTEWVNTNTMIEIKRPGVAGKKRGRTQARTNERQEGFRKRWRGHLVTLATPDEMRELVERA